MIFCCSKVFTLRRNIYKHTLKHSIFNRNQIGPPAEISSCCRSLKVRSPVARQACKGQQVGHPVAILAQPSFRLVLSAAFSPRFSWALFSIMSLEDKCKILESIAKRATKLRAKLWAMAEDEDHLYDDMANYQEFINAEEEYRDGLKKMKKDEVKRKEDKKRRRSIATKATSSKRSIRDR